MQTPLGGYERNDERAVQKYTRNLRRSWAYDYAVMFPRLRAYTRITTSIEEQRKFSSSRGRIEIFWLRGEYRARN